MARQVLEEDVCGFCGAHRSDQGRGVVSVQCAGEREDPLAGVVAGRGGHHPRSRFEGPDGSEAECTRTFARGPKEPGRRVVDRYPDVVRTERAGQGRPTEPYAGGFHRADRGRADGEPLPPTAVQPAFGEQLPVATLGEPHQAERLCRPQLVREEGGKGPGSAVGRTIAAQHQVGPAEGGHGCRGGPCRGLFVTGQLGRMRPVLGVIGVGNPDHVDTECADLAEDLVTRVRPDRHGHHPTRPGLGDAQCVLERCRIGRAQPDREPVVGHPTGQRIDLGSEIGDPQTGRDERVRRAHVFIRGGRRRRTRRRGRSR